MPDAARLAELIAGDFYGNNLDLSARGITPGDTWDSMPGAESLRRVRERDASDRTARRFVTFVCAMNRARDAGQLWRASADLFESHHEVFDPFQASTMPLGSLRDLLRSARVSRRHGPDSDGWRRIARSLTSGNGAACRVVEDGVGDAAMILGDLRSRQDGRTRYPLLRGPKIAPMWVRIMVNAGAQIHRMDVVPVAVDVQVRRVTENLGVTDTGHLKLRDAKPVIQSAWRAAVAKANIGGPPGIAGTCAALDPALWFFALKGCSYCKKVGRQVPISEACSGCRLPVSPRA